MRRDQARGGWVDIEPGTILAERFRVVRVLGRGGMGVVVEATHLVTDKRVAAKWLHPEIAKDAEASQRLIREATAACRVRHPNVVDVYDVIREGESIILVMELLEGEPLRGVFERGVLPIPQLLELVIPAMHGVAEAHRQGVVHRDIHPGNIFLARERSGGAPVPKVLDFGISKIGDDKSQRGLTRSGMTMGTPLYMSYEQLISARDVDARTDVYAFGVLLYEGLTGQMPFDGENFAAIAMQIVNGNAVPPRELRPEIPAGLERIVQSAMARNREDRTASLDALIAELSAFAAPSYAPTLMTDPELGPRPVAARSDRPPTPRQDDAARRIDTQGRASSPLAQSTPPQPAGKPANPRKRALLMGMGVGAAAAVLGAVVVLHGQKPAAPKAVPPAAPLIQASTVGVIQKAALVVPPAVDADAGQALPTVAPIAAPITATKPAVHVVPKPAPKPLTQPAPAQTSEEHFRAGRARREDF